MLDQSVNVWNLQLGMSAADMSLPIQFDVLVDPGARYLQVYLAPTFEMHDHAPNFIRYRIIQDFINQCLSLVAYSLRDPFPFNYLTGTRLIRLREDLLAQKRGISGDLTK